ncbi:MAG: CRISPR-associated endonuclease Cas3'' [Gemmiger sp.]|nr:CRISPR-associated endonuclease Cas3'' [Gemmiger sp.]
MATADYIAHRHEDGTVQTVAAHLQGTAQLAAQFADAFGAGAVGRTAGMLHDIGKYSAAFQVRIRDPEHTAKVDHSTAGAKAAIQNNLPEVAFAVAGHHGGLPDGGTRQDTAGTPTLFGRLSKQIPACEAWQQEIALPPCPPPPCRGKGNYAQAFFTRMLYSCLVDADYLDTEAFMQAAKQPPRGGYAALPTLLQKLRAKTDAFLGAAEPKELDAKRNAILQTCIAQGRHQPRGLYSLTVPTGGGKTIASLSFALEQAVALGMARVVYVIPYTSIIDQTVDVFGKILGPENVLAHHAGADYLLREEGELTPQEYRCALAAENWDAPVVVTTAVQFFESLYANRPARCRKLHNLANSVLVFDEAQTLPVPYLRPCVAAIAELVGRYRASAVLCTATQPALGPLFAEFGTAPPLQEICPGGAELYLAFRRTTLADCGVCSQAALAARLAEAPQVLCVVNRRSTAQALYAALPPEGRYCLTTLLSAQDRRAHLAAIRLRLRQGLPCRVVSTSLIEAGVDVDFPTAYREQAGLDSILQTAGRCNREGKNPAAESIVTVFRLEGSAPPSMLSQNIAALLAVQRLCPALDTPAAIAQYFTLLRGIKGSPALDRKEILPAFAQGRCGCAFPFAWVAEAFTLIESPTRSIYLPLGAGAPLCARLKDGERNRALFRALGPHSVSVYPDHFAALCAAGALDLPDENTAILADTSLYDPQTGLKLAVEGGQGWFF